VRVPHMARRRNILEVVVTSNCIEQSDHVKMGWDKPTRKKHHHVSYPTSASSRDAKKAPTVSLSEFKRFLSQGLLIRDGLRYQ
jgi:hypothetical protein